MEEVKRCGFYVKRKKRHCKMLPAKGNIYCAEHLCFQEDQEVLGQLAAVDHLGALVYKQDRKLNNGRALLIKH